MTTYRYRRVEVTWHDAAGVTGGWQSASAAIKRGREPSEAVTRGFLLHRDAKVVVIAQTLAKDGDVFNTFAIPSAFIRKVRFR